MTPRVFVYILTEIPLKIGRFFLHWYTRGSRIYWHAVLDFFSELERMVSLHITALNWYRPLYGDYTRLGMVVGIPIRLMRIFGSGILYAFLFAFFLMTYGAYLALPVFLLGQLAY